MTPWIPKSPALGIKQSIHESQWNSVVNKAPLTSRTNKFLGGDAPSAYIDRLERGKNVNHQKLNGILESHLICPSLLRQDDFRAFFRERASCLLDLIEEATGRPVEGRHSEEVQREFGGSLARSKEHGDASTTAAGTD